MSKYDRDFKNLMVELRGKIWTISDVTIAPADRSVGIMSDYPEGYELTDENGVKWNWDNELTETEAQKVDDVILAAEDERLAALYPPGTED